MGSRTRWLAKFDRTTLTANLNLIWPNVEKLGRVELVEIRPCFRMGCDCHLSALQWLATNPEIRQFQVSSADNGRFLLEVTIHTEIFYSLSAPVVRLKNDA